MGLSVPQIGKMIERAREQQCRNNLRQLHAGVMNFLQQNGDDMIQSQMFRYLDTVPHGIAGLGAFDEPKVIDKTWLCLINSGSFSRNLVISNLQNIDAVPNLYADLGIGEPARNAIEYGSLFPYMNDSFKHYACPTIVNKVNKALPNNREKIYRTYAMSSFYRYEKKFTKDTPYPSRTILFSECYPKTGTIKSFVYDDSSRDDSDGQLDPVSETATAVNCDVMGFNPYSNKWGVHYITGKNPFPTEQEGDVLVVFADGHVEKMHPVIRTLGGKKINVAWYGVEGQNVPE